MGKWGCELLAASYENLISEIIKKRKDEFTSGFVIPTKEES